MKVTHYTLLDTRQKYSPLVEIKIVEPSLYLTLFVLARKLFL